MRIQFLNRQNNNWFEIDEGPVLTESYNETLDSGIIRISHLSTPLSDVDSFDLVKIEDYPDYRIPTKYICVEDIDEKIVCLSPTIYNYEITLMSETKVLEGYLCPNLCITSQFRDGTPTNRSIYWYLQKYLDLYDEKIRVNGEFVNRHHFSETLISRFSSIRCPEFQWNSPTLREVINDLLLVDDCICKVVANEIQFIDITKKHNDISSYREINLIQKHQSSADYISEIRMNLKNTLQTSSDINNLVSKEEWCMLTTLNDSVLVTQDNVVLKTSFPIYRIKHLYVMLVAAPYDRVNNYIRKNHGTFVSVHDLCNIKTRHDSVNSNLVYESKEWNALNILAKLSDLPSYKDWVNTVDYQYYRKFTDLKLYQNTTLYYTRGSNCIEGFGRVSRSRQPLFTWYTTQTLIEYIRAIVGGILDEDTFNFDLLNIDADSILPGSSWSLTDVFKRLVFRVEYETLANVTFQASKSKRQNNYRTIVDNQTNSYIDAYSQGILEYMKANRLGNKGRFINAIYTNNYSNLIKCGDFYENSIVYEVQYSIFKNHINVNAQSTDDYILRDYYTGVQAKVRSWQIMSESEAMSREELFKVYLEFSFEEKNEYTVNDGLNANYFLSPLYSWDKTTPIKYLVTKIDDNSSKVYSMDLSSRLVGNSMVFAFGFVDNYEVARHYDKTKISYSSDGNFDIDLLDNWGGIPLIYYNYVDSHGEAVKFEWYISDNINFYMGGNKYPSSLLKTGFRIPALGGARNTGTTDFMVKVMDMPGTFVSTIPDDYIQKYEVNLYKDNKESIKVNIQYEICSETDDILFTEKFMKTQDAVKLQEHLVLASNLSLEYVEIKQFTPSHVDGQIYDTSFSIYVPNRTGKTLFYIKPSRILKITGSGESDYYEVPDNLVYCEVTRYDASEGKVYVRYLDNTDDSSLTQIEFSEYFIDTEEPHYCVIYERNAAGFDKNNISLDGATQVANSYITIEDNKVIMHGVSEDNTKIRFICDLENNILIAVKGKTEFYLNLLRIRSDNVYDSNKLFIVDHI